MARRIEILVPRKGISTGERTVKIEADGYTGTTCQDATRAIEKILGAHREYVEKPEMYDSVSDIETITGGNE